MHNSFEWYHCLIVRQTHLVKIKEELQKGVIIPVFKWLVRWQGHHVNLIRRDRLKMFSFFYSLLDFNAYNRRLASWFRPMITWVISAPLLNFEAYNRRLASRFSHMITWVTLAPPIFTRYLDLLLPYLVSRTVGSSYWKFLL